MVLIIQLSFTWKGKSRSHFVRQPDVAAVKQQLRNYRRLRQLLDRWMILAMELSQLRLQQPPRQGRATTKMRRKSSVS